MRDEEQRGGYPVEPAAAALTQRPPALRLISSERLVLRTVRSRA
jgi:hypothetical protein